MAGRRPLLAGSLGPERIPARPHPDEADWYLPLHVRDEAAARERIAAQVTLGADVVVAPAWLTHRRALLPLGETRRAADWTTAAVRVARQAVELGLEHREEALADAPEDDIRRGRPAPRVAAPLPALDDDPEPETGRLLPREAATERDYRDQAGVLADAAPDLLLVEGQRAQADARVAIIQAVDTGLPTWAALRPTALSADGVAGWLEWAGASGLQRLLLPGAPAAATPAAESSLAWGAVATSTDVATRWLELGAGAIGQLDGATPAVLQGLRRTIDDYERAAVDAERAAGRRWRDTLHRAAAMAPGGVAAWVGERPDETLPQGFDWVVIDPLAMHELPPDRFRLLVVVPPADPRPAARSVDRGGILVCQATPGLDLRLLELDDASAPPLAAYRREP